MLRRHRTAPAVVLLVVAAVAAIVVVAAGAVGPGPSPAQAATIDASTHTFVSGATSPMSFTSFECAFAVPELPREYGGQSIFPWCGIQQISATDPALAFGVLQPVLMYGPDCTSATLGLGPAADPAYRDAPYWYYSAQYVYSDAGGQGTCATGPGFRATPGEVLVSRFVYDPVGDTVTVSMAREDGSDTSTFVADHPWLDAARSWADLQGDMQLQVTLETPRIEGPDQWPSGPASWPVTMTYEGAEPTVFGPEPRTRIGPGVTVAPGITCTAPTVVGPTATAVCTYALGDTQIFPTVPTTSTPTTGTPGAPAALVAPNFAG
jgi:hypothetical protein